MLRLARLTDYALVVLAHLVREAPRCVHPASDISDATGLPQPTVAKVLKTLCREGILRSVRGAHGGYALDRDPSKLSVADVVEAMEGPVALTACSVAGVGEVCGDESSCRLADHWPRINAAVVGALRDVTVLDLAQPEFPHRDRRTPSSHLSASTAAHPMHRSES